MRSILVALIVSTFGCAVGAELDVPEAADIILSPSPDAEQVVRSAAARWAEATGLRIIVDNGGVPINLVDDTIDPSGYRVCAFTVSSFELGPMYVDIDGTPPEGKCNTLLNVVTHEIGHVICNHFEPGADCHSEHGIMRSARKDDRDDFMNDLSLDAVCAVAPCSSYQPEN